jgi:hypothetical protein
LFNQYPAAAMAGIAARGRFAATSARRGPFRCNTRRQRLASQQKPLGARALERLARL